MFFLLFFCYYFFFNLFIVSVCFTLIFFYLAHGEMHATNVVFFKRKNKQNDTNDMRHTLRSPIRTVKTKTLSVTKTLSLHNTWAKYFCFENHLVILLYCVPKFLAFSNPRHWKELNCIKCLILLSGWLWFS